MRLCREFALELFGLALSDGTIQQAIHESGYAGAPLNAQLTAEATTAQEGFCDESPHFQAGKRLWLWVFTTATTAVFFIGRRTKEVFWGRIGHDFAGWLMADGYRVYRAYAYRLRCWAHLIGKARGLAETFTAHVQGYGRTLMETFEALLEAVYQAREGPPRDLRPLLAAELARLKALCQKLSRSSNAKAAALGREFLNDWEALFRVLEFPHLALTNNFAERLLRHWVILRRITYGTRTVQGSLTQATIASIMETCRLRKASPLRYLHQVIAARRRGGDVPPLAPVPAAA